ncbi:MAG: hypothetical protein M3N12_07720 [Verrucomicrobiota bacterium]|nr:hypothetical protein [Verrucomicrobiota bacterium]
MANFKPAGRLGARHSFLKGNGLEVGDNDDWKSTQQTEIQATTLAATGDLESAVLLTLPAGNYTAIVRGFNNTTGVGLVELYNVQ